MGRAGEKAIHSYEFIQEETETTWISVKYAAKCLGQIFGFIPFTSCLEVLISICIETTACLCGSVTYSMFNKHKWNLLVSICYEDLMPLNITIIPCLHISLPNNQMSLFRTAHHNCKQNRPQTLLNVLHRQVGSAGWSLVLSACSHFKFITCNYSTTQPPIIYFSMCSGVLLRKMTG